MTRWFLLPMMISLARSLQWVITAIRLPIVPDGTNNPDKHVWQDSSYNVCLTWFLYHGCQELKTEKHSQDIYRRVYLCVCVCVCIYVQVCNTCRFSKHGRAHFFELNNSRVVAKDIVAQFGVDHCLLHCCCRFGHLACVELRVHFVSVCVWLHAREWYLGFYVCVYMQTFVNVPKDKLHASQPQPLNLQYPSAYRSLEPSWRRDTWCWDKYLDRQDFAPKHFLQQSYKCSSMSSLDSHRDRDFPNIGSTKQSNTHTYTGTSS